ncbi:hypothetical protein [Nostoc sp.]|uniref:hypothetical protein n=1 Tax=Nostoc sp. TaxID=1180 RepID=UPI002FF51FEE
MLKERLWYSFFSFDTTSVSYFNLLELSKMTRQILNTQCPIRSLAHDDRTIKVKKLEQRPIATLSRN